MMQFAKFANICNIFHNFANQFYKFLDVFGECLGALDQPQQWSVLNKGPGSGFLIVGQPAPQPAVLPATGSLPARKLRAVATASYGKTWKDKSASRRGGRGAT